VVVWRTNVHCSLDRHWAHVRRYFYGLSELGFLIWAIRRIRIASFSV
jgi:hypothetical protein